MLKRNVKILTTLVIGLSLSLGAITVNAAEVSKTPKNANTKKIEHKMDRNKKDINPIYSILKSKLGYTDDQIKEAVKAKKTAFDLAKDKNISADQLKTMIIDEQSKKLDEAVSNGKLTKDKADAMGIKPIAKIIAQTSFAQEPEWFTTAPAYAIQNIVKKANMNIEDIDVFEINEAFAVQALSVIKTAKLDASRVNLNGGAVALGHPIGASGARILTTLINVLQQQNKKYGLATLCIGGGEASALIIERI